MIQKLLFDYNKNDTITNIENSEIETINTFTSKINFYNPDINEPLHKFWFFIPNAKLIKKTDNTIKIVLSSNEKKLINSICSLDILVDNIISSHTNNIKNINSSLAQTAHYPPVLELSIDNKVNCYNSNNEKINYMSLYNGSKIQLYIEFESVIINSSKCTKKWKVLQMKKEIKIDLSVNLFDMPIPEPIARPRFCPIPPPINIVPKQNISYTPIKKSSNHQNISPPNTGSCYLAPTQNQLLHALNQLKKKKRDKTDIKTKSQTINPVINSKKKYIIHNFKNDIKSFKKHFENDNENMLNNYKNFNAIIKNIDNVILLKKNNSIFGSDSEPEDYNKNNPY